MPDAAGIINVSNSGTPEEVLDRGPYPVLRPTFSEWPRPIPQHRARRPRWERYFQAVLRMTRWQPRFLILGKLGRCRSGHGALPANPCAAAP